MNKHETHLLGDPQLPFLFHRRMTCHGKNLGGTNWHENIEIIHVVEGEGIVTSDTLHLEVTCGDTVVINTNCLHSFAARGAKFSYHCLIVDRSFCQANYFDTNEIRFDPCFHDEAIGALLTRLADEYAAPQATPYRTQSIRALILQIMAHLCREHSTITEQVQHNAYLLSCIKQAIGLIRSESDRDLSLDEISNFVGLSKYYFAREFHRVTGYTFVSYVNLTRCEKAKVLLAENRLSIGEIGRACGFENQSYFSRTFRNYTGILPGAYRERKKAKQALEK